MFHLRRSLRSLTKERKERKKGKVFNFFLTVMVRQSQKLNLTKDHLTQRQATFTYCFYGTTREAGNFVEATGKKFNSVLHNNDLIFYVSE